MVLLQTMVISMILAYMGISITRWVLNRYMSATRTYRSGAARASAGGYAMKVLASPTPPASGTTNATIGTTGNLKNISYTSSGGVITVSYDEEQ